VAEEDQRHRAFAPQVAEPHIPARIVLQDHVLEVAGVGRGMGALPDLYRVKHECRLPFRLEVNVDVNGQKQPAQAGEESPAEPRAVPSEAAVAKVGDLLAASELAARAIRERATVDDEALSQSATEDAVVHSREQLPQLEASVSQLTELVKQLRAEVDQLRAELHPDGGGGQPLTPPAAANGSPRFDQRGLLIALNMAGNGASRSEVADYLAEYLGLRDCEDLLGAVYEYVDSTRRGPRETR
jgi:hypothetical protein